MYCPDCIQYFCKDFNTQVHRHPKRSHHSPEDIAHPMDITTTYSTDEEYDMEISPTLESSFVDAQLNATLADKFKMTSFKPFQKKVTEATLSGQDTLVLYPTGSGKNLCHQFRPIYRNKKAIVITPTISLM